MRLEVLDGERRALRKELDLDRSLVGFQNHHLVLVDIRDIVATAERHNDQYR
jgi:hypothetical protein